MRVVVLLLLCFGVCVLFLLSIFFGVCRLSSSSSSSSSSFLGCVCVVSLLF